MQRYGGLPFWVAVPIMLLLASYLALYVGVFTLLVRRATLAGPVLLGGRRVGTIVGRRRLPLGPARHVAGDRSAPPPDR
jgi:hypothetical protein